MPGMRGARLLSAVTTLPSLPQTGPDDNMHIDCRRYVNPVAWMAAAVASNQLAGDETGECNAAAFALLPGTSYSSAVALALGITSLLAHSSATHLPPCCYCCTHSAPPALCLPVPTEIIASNGSPTTVSAFLDSGYGYYPSLAWPAVGILFAFVALFRIISTLAVSSAGVVMALCGGERMCVRSDAAWKMHAEVRSALFLVMSFCT